MSADALDVVSKWVGRKLRLTIGNGTVQFVDNVDPTSAVSRDSLLERVRKRLPAVDVAVVEQHLLQNSEPPKAGAAEATAPDQLVFDPKRTLATAKKFLVKFYKHPDGSTLRSYAGALWQWDGSRFAEAEEVVLRQQIFDWLDPAAMKDQEGKLKPFPANPRTVGDVVATIHTQALLPAATPVPSWLSRAEAMPPPSELLPCKTKILHIPTGNTLQPTPAFFNFAALDFDYDPNAATPTRWFSFLFQLFDADVEALNMLQQWFGYVLTADTNQQKMLLLVGPRRSGKGTIARILRKLVGTANCVGPTTSSLAGNFGLQPLIGKTLAVVSDARFSGENVATVVERLLCISGEDAISVDRKFSTAVTMKLPTRFLFLTNELPRFNDSSAALAGRFLLLKLTRSFFDHENVNLTDELSAELPGILLWALEGRRRLLEHGHFVEPESSRAAMQELEDLSSPVSAFVGERCTIGPGYRVNCKDLYAAWQVWCNADGRSSCTTAQVFGRDLGAAVPGVSRRRCTGRPAWYEGIKLGTEEAP